MVTFPSLDPLYAGYSVCCVSSHPTPSALLEADLYELHHPDYLTPRLLFGFCQWKVLAGDLRAGKERKVRAFISLLHFCL